MICLNDSVLCGPSQIEREIAYVRSFADIRDVREAFVIAGQLGQYAGSGLLCQSIAQLDGGGRCSVLVDQRRSCLGDVAAVNLDLLVRFTFKLKEGCGGC